MKKLSSKLFQDLELKNAEVVKVIGGRTAYTLKGSDTDPVGYGYDVLFPTVNTGNTDSAMTDPTDNTTNDKPLP